MNKASSYRFTNAAVKLKANGVVASRRPIDLHHQKVVKA